MEFTPGTIVAGKYRVGHLLGSGGAGEVWEAENVGIGARVALKKLRHASSHDATVRFRREAVILARIRSDHVARVLDFCEDPAFGYVLVLDLIEGESLSETLKFKRLGVEEAIGLGTDLLSGLADLHRARIVHRDLKPSNIIEQVFDDGTRRAVIVDFGVSRLLADDAAGGDDDAVTDITRGAMTIGTITYMAPEQLVNSSKVSYQADLYAVGTLLFRSVAGELPFAGMSQAALASIKRVDEAPRLVSGRTDPRAVAFERVVGRALRRRPEDRFPSADAMLGELRALKNEAGESAILRAPIQDFDSEASLVTEPMLELSDAQMAALAETARRTAAPTEGDGASPNATETPAVARSAWTPAPAPAPEPIAASPAPPASSRAWLFAAVGVPTIGALIAGVLIGRASGSHPQGDALPAAVETAVETSTAAATASSAAPPPSEAPEASSAPVASANASAEPVANDDAPAASGAASPERLGAPGASGALAAASRGAAPRPPGPRSNPVAVNAAVSAATTANASAEPPRPTGAPASSATPPPTPTLTLKREPEL